MITSAAAAANKAAELLFDQRPMSHRFVVSLDRSGYDLGTWSRVSGLTVRWSRLSYRVGENNEEHVLPGNAEYESLTLTRAACSDSSNVQKWLAETTRRRLTYSGSVSLTDFLHIPILSWEFGDLFPISWSLAEFDAGSSTPIVETLELAHSGFLDDGVRLGPR